MSDPTALREAAQALVIFAGRFSAGDSDVQREDLQVAIDDLRAALAAPPAAPSEDALEAAFTKAVNAPSASGRGIAVPHYRDVERIWAAIRAAAGDGGLDVERERVLECARRVVSMLFYVNVTNPEMRDLIEAQGALSAAKRRPAVDAAHTESATDGSGEDYPDHPNDEYPFVAGVNVVDPLP